MYTVDNRVKELRNEKGLRQEDLAGKINVSQQTVSRIENILKLSDVRMTQEYRIDVERSLERNMNFCNAFERLSRTNQELVIRLMEQLDDSQNVKNEKE